MSSAMMTRMLGGVPAAPATGADCCARAVVIGAADCKLAAASIEVPVNSMFRRSARRTTPMPPATLRRKVTPCLRPSPAPNSTQLIAYGVRAAENFKSRPAAVGEAANSRRGASTGGNASVLILRPTIGGTFFDTLSPLTLTFS